MAQKTENTDSKRKRLLIYLLILIPVIGVSIWGLTSFNQPVSAPPPVLDQVKKDSVKTKDSLDFIEATTDSQSDSNYQALILSQAPSNAKDTSIIGYDADAGHTVKKIYTGRRINIAVIGVDTRMGTTTKHADANHILSFMLDSGKIEIYSIPRDSPADAGMADSTGQNKITIVRAVKGVQGYLKAAAKIAGLDKIHYYMEASFSQVIGILDLLGYKDPASTLQVLRSRTGLGGDDFQRVYNQAQFIRQTILKHYNKLNGPLGGILTSGALMFVDTDLNSGVINQINTEFAKFKFPRSEQDIKIKIRPAMRKDFAVYNMTNQASIDQLANKIESFNKCRYEKDSSGKAEFVHSRPNVLNKLNSLIAKAERDSSKSPKNVISSLQNYFSQKVWMQVEDKAQRDQIRMKFCNLLASAYARTKQPQKAEFVRKAIAAEVEMFNKQIFK